MAEVPTRLTPKAEVVRELYLKSGNQCAYPGCDHLIMNKDGVFIGEICHIEAAMPGGERFNPEQTNEERRSFENLLLLCHEHHKVTDDTIKFDVAKLRSIKAQHEEKFTDAVSKIRNSIVDHTTLVSESFPQTLEKLNKVLEWNMSMEDLSENIKELIPFIKNLKKIPLRTRKLLSIMLERSSESRYELSVLEVPVPEILEACHIEISDLRDHFSILQKYSLVSEGDNDDYGTNHIDFCNLSCGWPIWNDIKVFSEKNSNSLSEFIEDLNFCLFD